ncbi:enoyl-CoA hydratase-related protein [Actinomadura madurae]|uniref:enoyl-CoA hydratase-related protein n=1 Tax=Actinomadura madurae TaxID=1993 RepID=UPI0020268D97|nr:enoyl-CoA hydratase-related protein [Actinomadura madurae]URM99025.1 enoyl-CoA hydratase-related protein [Actinomadura madurae]URN09711.1 enoyl-CoA hydratase-related protein [Actinomadura madurae]
MTAAPRSGDRAGEPGAPGGAAGRRDGPAGRQDGAAGRQDGAEEARIQVDVSGGLARLVFANPRRRNALTSRMMLDAAAALDRLAADLDVRVLIVSGHGATFSAGADLRGMPGGGGDAPDAAAELFRGLDGFDRPVIALIRGHCLGAGAAVALHADVRIAAPDSVFGIPAARVGIGYPMPEVKALVAAVGPSAAADLLYTARRVDGVEAHRMGLVTRLAADGDLDAVTASVAESIAANAPLSVRAAKAAIAAVTSPDRPAHRCRAERLLDLCAGSADAKEGARAILEKRPPVFVGR